MAQILHKRTSTPAAVPTALQATVGELILNVNDGILFTKKLDGTVITIGTSAIDGGFPSDTYSNIPIIDGGTP